MFINLFAYFITFSLNLCYLFVNTNLESIYFVLVYFKALGIIYG
ncbi:hypothetical protein CBB_0314 [Clostridium botulinum Bf]|uniref:Uncharacterized protein n=1 Tax=Clostridium botulinum (strain 657 / Type Ba4) TaxID=515621 RepID=A0A3F2ZV35_CLOB6|nr:hypothetical protein CLK_3487 [Clostridium botulinum A3 str. Loch Maree]ACQ54089.1 hypothetical protein CLJ_B0348 [Clostridium botulinum Ba4 str. 657]EDT86468.1 hypothetical protein CBB_0314 [Clostridium botulinum Bf]